MALSFSSNLARIRSNACEINARTGSAVRSPLTGAKAMSVVFGKAATAIASETGEIQLTRERPITYLMKN
ncbi:hypothetical protein ACFSRY_13125 [Pontibacter locisalis]|uniref:Uncharacterized protein n=1 Tax=Pontibacter locisalis TaxID=1719035 RepID=A0ABW5IMH1_9BACT